MAKLVLVRHGKSVWNELGLWTGLTDVALAPDGIAEARNAAEALKDMHFDIAFTSKLKRAQQTLQEMLAVLGQEYLPIQADGALNERDYGDFTGKNKWDIQKAYGNEQFLRWRRAWNIPIPGGEGLKDVYNRVVPYYQLTILPHLRQGQTVLIVAHGNSLRALVKYLEQIPDKAIASLEIATGEVYVYDIDTTGNITKKEVRSSHPNLV